MKKAFQTYLPQDEVYISQRNSSFDSRYKFSAKELDPATNFSYFGARYYDSELSVWLSVDALSDKYPSMSPYMYVLGNPVKLIDIDGLFPISPSFRKNYPKLTKFIETKMQDHILNSNRISSALHKWSGGNLTSSQIIQDFAATKHGRNSSVGEGPLITDYNYNDGGGTMDWGGEYNYETNTIQINKADLDFIERVMQNSNSEDKRKSSLMSFMYVFVNEYTHYGDALDGFDLEIDEDGTFTNNISEPHRGMSVKTDEGNKCRDELYPFLNPGQNYRYYLEGRRFDPQTGRTIDIDEQRIDKSMIPPDIK